MLYRWDKNYIQYIANVYSSSINQKGITKIAASSSYYVSGNQIILNSPNVFTPRSSTNIAPGTWYQFILYYEGDTYSAAEKNQAFSPSSSYRVNEYSTSLFQINTSGQIVRSKKGAGEFVEYVYSSQQDTYPNNSDQGGYWYDNRKQIDTPSAPNTITVPQVVANQPVTITWGTSTAQVGNVVSYTLQRSVNGSNYTTIYTGANISYQDTAGDWATVAYRVFATDNYGSNSSNQTSSTQVVQDGILYISGPVSAMGSKVAPFAFEISTGVSGSEAAVSDIAVEISLDGNQIYSSTVDTGEEISVTIDTRTIGGGSHTIEATASKTDNISTAETYTFTTPRLSLPDGGLGVQLQDDQGRAVFPQSIASLIGGLYGQSVAGNLQQLAKSVLFNRIATPKYQEVTVDLSAAQEGDVVQLPENGVLASFYVAKINYEQGLNGTGRVLLVRSSSPGNRAWNSGNVNAYSGSDIDTWLNGTYKAMFPEEIQTAMGTTEFYYTPGNGNYVVTTLERSVFLPSVSEMGQSLENANTEGSAISSTVVSRLGYIGFTRTPSTNRNDMVFANNSLLSNGWGEYFADYSQGSRPAFTLPSTFSYTIYVGSDGIHDAQEYTDGGTFSDYFGNDIPLPKIALSTYVGTGTYGSENPNSLTFDFPVKAVCIAPETFPSNSQKAGTSLWLRGCTSGYLIRAYADDPTGEILNITWTENGLQWYGKGSADQMNLAQSTYVVIAFG